jgi:hypothetical protein
MATEKKCIDCGRASGFFERCGECYRPIVSVGPRPPITAWRDPRLESAQRLPLPAGERVRREKHKP